MGRCRGDGAKPTPTPTPNQETHLVESSAGKATAQLHDELSVAQVRDIGEIQGRYRGDIGEI